MNIVSFLAVITGILYFVLLARRAVGCKNDLLVQVSLGVFACLGWWAFCDAFFYVAETKEQAWFWLRLGGFGYSGFIPVTAYYFLVMCQDAQKYLNTWIRKLLWWTPAAVYTCMTVFGNSYTLADELVQSTSGLGWTYQQSFTSFWPYALYVELGLYLGVALIRLYLWQRRMEGKDVRMLSTEFIILDAVAVFVGILTIYVVPHFTTYWPPLSFIATMVFLIGYQNELSKHDLMHIELAMDPGSIFESSMDAMLITDISWRILYVNEEAKRILDLEEAKGTYFTDNLCQEGRELLVDFEKSNKKRGSGLDLILSNHIPLFCSITRTTTRNQEYEVFILSLHDASTLKDAQQKLDYLAHYDELTGLPNRRKLGELLDNWEHKYVMKGGDFSILFLDLNHFKRINDYYGHSAGDTALQETAKALKSCIPKFDVVTRLAGDEFIVLHAPESITTEEMGDRIHEAISAIDCATFAPGHHMETSIGFCKYSEAGSVRELFKLADERMYAIKNQRLEER